MLRPIGLLGALALLAAASCEATAPSTGAPTAKPAATPMAAAPATASPSASAAAPPEKPAAPKPILTYKGFSTPESVLWDEANDRYLVSNINGGPAAVDNNGFISVLSPDGTVTNLKWIEGGKNQVKLDAPKGSAIDGGILYVADITTVRMFDLKTGAPKGEVKIPGATFLNDVSGGEGGRIYVSDSGVKPGAKGFDPTGTDAVYVIEKGKAKAVAKGTDLGRPNGVLATDKGPLVVTFGAADVYRLDEKGAKSDTTKLPKGSLDGIVGLADGSLIISSWEGSCIFKGKLGGAFEAILSDQKSPADIGYDKKRSRLLVPHFTEDTVEVYEVK